MGLLTRKRRQQPSSSSSPALQIRPALSLPDLTTPLLDVDAWEELPNVAVTTLPGGRNRAPSLVGRDRGFHRPFNTTTGNNDNKDKNIHTDFREGPLKSWGRERESTFTSGTGVSGAGKGKRGKGKLVNRLNVAVVGGKAVGKTSFIHLLLDSLVENPSSLAASDIRVMQHRATRKFEPRSTMVTCQEFEKTSLWIVDTPGLEVGSDLSSSNIKERERHRGIDALVRMLEERFTETLREESRIVRVKPRMDDELIHLVVYLIDARKILHPASDTSTSALEVDWSSLGLFDGVDEDQNVDAELSATPKLSSIELAILHRLATRANVLPILTFADSLTVSELDLVKSTTRRDLAAAFPDDEGHGFGLFANFASAEDGEVSPPSVNSSPPLQADREDKTPKHHDIDVEADRPPTPASSTNDVDGRLPFAIFNPEPGGLARTFPWGVAEVMDDAQSDFTSVREAILGSQQKTLRTTTREVLYENFRTEKLLAKEAARRG
ncbi:hypothetical protein P7C73_g5090, partial [Tremellales sp. Uapishka_1]